MHELQKILYNVSGQELAITVPEGRPSSVTSVTVYDADQTDTAGVENATTGSASIDAVDTTVDAASGNAQADSSLLNVADTAGIVNGRVYLATDALGRKEWVECAGISTGVHIKTRAPLANDYVAADTLQGTRVSIGIDSTWVADSNNLSASRGGPGYRVRWEYVVGGVTSVLDTYFSVVRYAGESTISPADMVRFSPSWSKVLPDYHESDQGARLIAEAEIEVRMDLKAINRLDWALRERETLDRLIQYKSIVLLQQDRIMRGGVGIELFEAARTNYEMRLDQMIRTVANTPEDVDNSGAAAKRAALPVSVR
jgi:hypothetical protein